MSTVIFDESSQLFRRVAEESGRNLAPEEVELAASGAFVL